jgi:hypothetical protein
VIGLIVSYAFAIQSLLAGFTGLPVPSISDAGLPVFELCLNGADQVPGSPAGPPGDVCSHCILCMAGSQHLLSPPPPYRMQQLGIDVGSVSAPTDHRHLLSVNNYSVAQPRAPPLGV